MQIRILCGWTKKVSLDFFFNSLLEAVVFSKRIYKRISELGTIKQNEFPDIPPWDSTGVVRSEESVLISHDRSSIQRLMWEPWQTKFVPMVVFH